MLCNNHCWLLGLALAFSLTLSTQASILLVGKEGQQTEVFGILEARPDGLVLKVSKESPLITVSWDKLDLEALQQTSPEAYYGYLDVQNLQKPILLKLGGFADIVSFEEAILRLYQSMERARFYPLPENVNYLFESDPDVIRMKERDYPRYMRVMRDYRRELQNFLRQIFPREAIIIDDQGKLHRKQREGLADMDKGESSLGTITRYLADTRRTVSRVGILYLREVSHFPEDFYASISQVRHEVPNSTFRYGNPNHMRLPVILDEALDASRHMMEAKSLYRGQHYKLGEFYNFIYGQAEVVGIDPSKNPLGIGSDTTDFPQLDF